MNIHNAKYREHIIDWTTEHASPATCREVYEVVKEYISLTDLNNAQLFNGCDMGCYNICLLELDKSLKKFIKGQIGYVQNKGIH